ncbi:MAG: transglycosylase SLT domain-containing protein [Gammaproteobacteria bacterium]|nr:transglycosylase SLT domain-containing protein [Gammaproteobacteria bacterium]
MAAVIAAILWLAPHVGQDTAARYGTLIVTHAAVAGVDPLLVVAVIETESRWNPRATSPTRDYGLMQLHVSETTHRRYLGRQRLLYSPARNIRLGVKLLGAWRRHHERRCHGARGHPYWSHYKYGIKVPGARKGLRVDAVYRRLRARFRAW